ncbi:MAG: PIN domain-containing protein [Oscillospiraceae bacterium]|jgi:predicted nucleic acid-binding protein|nr:PIN domain-containing protein [Oscillospiraceae bacterium]
MPIARVYLDTSVPSHLLAPDTPEKERDTRALWDDFRSGKFQAVLSDVTIAELGQCVEPKRSFVFEKLGQIHYEIVKVDDATQKIAQKFIDFGILTEKSLYDCIHIASAITSKCDTIVSWNFRHIVKHKTIQGAKAVTALSGYPEILIYAPSSLLEDNEYDTRYT